MGGPTTRREVKDIYPAKPDGLKNVRAGSADPWAGGRLALEEERVAGLGVSGGT